MTPEQAFAKALRDLRKRKKMSQEELALSSELDRTFISMLERNERAPSLTTIFKLAESLDIKASELMKLVENNRRQ